MENTSSNSDPIKIDLKNFKLKNQMSLTDLFDQAFMEAYELNDSEYDFICENATDEELDILIDDKNLSFKILRQKISIVKKYKTLHAENSARHDF